VLIPVTPPEEGLLPRAPPELYCAEAISECSSSCDNGEQTSETCPGGRHSDDRKNEIGYQTLANDNTFLRYLPKELRDILTKNNEHNPHQIEALNTLSELLADNSRSGQSSGSSITKRSRKIDATARSPVYRSLRIRDHQGREQGLASCRFQSANQ
jgi:hypothetical protein